MVAPIAGAMMASFYGINHPPVLGHGGAQRLALVMTRPLNVREPGRDVRIVLDPGPVALAANTNADVSTIDALRRQPPMSHTYAL